MSEDNGAHENLNGPDTLQRHLALASRLVHAELVTELLLGNGVGVVNLVTEDHKGNLGELLHGEKSVKLGLGLGESLVVLGVDEEDDAVDFREVVLPEAAGLLVTAEIEGCEAHVADGELLGSCRRKVVSFAPDGLEDTCARLPAASSTLLGQGGTHWGEEWAEG